MSETYSAGIATAYGSAKRAGYTGSYADFCAAMAAITAPSATASGLPAGSDPTAAYNDGVFAFGIPKGDKGDTGATGPQGPEGATGATGNGIASIAKTATVGKTDTYTITYTDGTTTTFDVTNGEVTEAQMEAELAKKANTSGTYSDLIAGLAEGLNTDEGTTIEEPYNLKVSGGNGREKLNKIVGVSVGWNQLYNKETATNKGITFTNTNGKITPSGQNDGTGNSFFTQNFSGIPAGHKILLLGGVAESLATTIYLYCVSGTSYLRLNSGKTAGIHEKQDDGNFGVTILAATGVDADDYNYTFIPQVCDLTLALGSTIADYVYNLEVGTSGAGVAWLKQHFSKMFGSYQPYDAGSIQSVTGLSAHVMTGFNQWDEEWEVGSINAETGENTLSVNQIRSKNYIPILPETTYYFKVGSYTGTNVKPRYYDANKNYIGIGTTVPYSSTFTTPANAHYFRFGMQDSYGTTYKNDICINIHYDGERDGEYEAYKEWNYPLDDSLTLRGLLKLDASNNLYADGDEYEADGTVERRYGEKTYDGSEEWAESSVAQNVYYLALNTTTFPQLNDPSLQMVSNKYQYAGSGTNATFLDSYSAGVGAWVNTANPTATQRYFYVKDSSISSVADFKASLAANPLTVVFTLQTAGTESADPYTESQIVDGSGTEEFVSTSIVPVGNETFYLTDLKGKLEDLPTIQEAPTTNGTYVLKATVSGGVASYSWVSE